MPEKSENPDIAAIRSEYQSAGLRREHLPSDPLDQLQKWIREAVTASLPEPTAMTLATASPDGLPAARVVLLKGVDERGLRFFTHYESAKGRELEKNPRAALCLLWKELYRQVRVVGRVRKVASEESRAYFHSRPRGSQIGAWASPQSQPLGDRHELEKKIDALERRFGDGEIPLPPFWGGYLLQPDSFEFWQGRRSRLHDRFLYRRLADRDQTAMEEGDSTAGPSDEAGWSIERLAP